MNHNKRFLLALLCFCSSIAVLVAVTNCFYLFSAVTIAILLCVSAAGLYSALTVLKIK